MDLPGYGSLRPHGLSRAVGPVLLAVLTLLAMVFTQRVEADLSVGPPSLVPATAPHAPAAASLAIPDALRAAVAEKLGGMGLHQSVADDAGLHVGAGAKQAISWSLTPVAWGRLGSTSISLNGANPLVAGDRTTYAMGSLTA